MGILTIDQSYFVSCQSSKRLSLSRPLLKLDEGNVAPVVCIDIGVIGLLCVYVDPKISIPISFFIVQQCVMGNSAHMLLEGSESECLGRVCNSLNLPSVIVLNGSSNLFSSVNKFSREVPIVPSAPESQWMDRD